MLTTDEIQIWTARPKQFENSQWGELRSWLDSNEVLQAERFNLESDRRSYILAHALRRFALSHALQVPPAHIAFKSDAHGKPCLTGTKAHSNNKLFFSHARRRELVVFAVTSLAPIGVDVEAYDASGATIDLLEGFVSLSPAQLRAAQDKNNAGQHFYFYWTVTEAFWKSRDVGLSFDHSPLRCEITPSGLFNLSLDRDPRGACAVAVPLTPQPDCVMTLVIGLPPADVAPVPFRMSYKTAEFFGAGRWASPVAEQEGVTKPASINEAEHQA